MLRKKNCGFLLEWFYIVLVCGLGAQSQTPSFASTAQINI